ncbi:hypothetical protein GCM10020000_20630 [Streptomyces olivoverticillatus]
MQGTVPTVPLGHPPRRQAPSQRGATARSHGPQAVHEALICVALPALAISGEHGQLTGHGLDGFYRGGRRLLARCRVRVGGAEPLPVQGRMLAADRARFVGTVRTTGDAGPDPAVTVERLRDAEGIERITLRSAAAQEMRLGVEVSLGTDLAELGAVAAGMAGPEIPPGVHASGLRWAAPGVQAVVTADPPPGDVLASAGLLGWEIRLPPGGTRSIELRVRMEVPGGPRPAETVAPRGRGGTMPWGEAEADGDDPRAAALLAAALDDLRALLVRDPPCTPATSTSPPASPWRCGRLAPAEALWAARMTLPLGVRLAAGTLRTLARTQLSGPGADNGRIAGALRHAGPHLPPGCTGVEATLLFPVVLAEARRWGLPDQEVRPLLLAAERCLAWLRHAVGDGKYLADPPPGGPYRCETQAHAHRAALLGADLLEAYGRPGAEAWREWATALRRRFREDFWADDLGGGRPSPRALPTAGGYLCWGAPPRTCSTPVSSAVASTPPGCSTRYRPNNWPGCSAGGPRLGLGAAQPRCEGARIQPLRAPQRGGTHSRDGRGRGGARRSGIRKRGGGPAAGGARRGRGLRLPAAGDVRGGAALGQRRTPAAPRGLQARRGRRCGRRPAAHGARRGAPRRPGGKRRHQAAPHRAPWARCGSPGCASPSSRSRCGSAGSASAWSRRPRTACNWECENDARRTVRRTARGRRRGNALVRCTPRRRGEQCPRPCLSSSRRL